MRTLRDKIDEYKQERGDLLDRANGLTAAAQLQESVAGELWTQQCRLLTGSAEFRSAAEKLRRMAEKLEILIDELEREADRRES